MNAQLYKRQRVLEFLAGLKKETGEKLEFWVR